MIASIVYNDQHSGEMMTQDQQQSATINVQFWALDVLISSASSLSTFNIAAASASDDNALSQTNNINNAPSLCSPSYALLPPSENPTSISSAKPSYTYTLNDHSSGVHLITSPTISGVSQWLSTHATANLLLQSACGCSKSERTHITRSIKLVESWAPGWLIEPASADKRSAEETLSNPFAPMHLLENLLHHQKIQYITMHNHTKRSPRAVIVNRLTTADILLYCILQSWFTSQESSRNFVLRSLPAVSSYTVRIREELMELCSPAHRSRIFPDSWLYQAPVSDRGGGGRGGEEEREEKERRNTDKKHNNINSSSCRSSSAKDVSGFAAPVLASASSSSASSSTEYSFKFSTFAEGSSKRINRKQRTVVHLVGAAHSPGSCEDIAGEGTMSKNVSPNVSDEVIDSVLVELGAFVDWRAAAAAAAVTASDTCRSSGALLQEEDSVEVENNKTFAMWEALNLPVKRSERKQQQIRSMLLHAVRLVPRGGTAVEFCAGGGYVGLAMAALRPDVTVILTDMNAISLKFAERRAVKMGLTNILCCRSELQQLIDVIMRRKIPATDNGSVGAGAVAGAVAVTGTGTGTIAAVASAAATATATGSSYCSPPSVIMAPEDLPRTFDVGIALHACGTATDSVLTICSLARASFVVSPCCYGTMRLCEGVAGKDDLKRFGNISYPQSDAFRSRGWQAHWFPKLCARADRTFWSHDSRAMGFNIAGVQAMRAVDSDRLLSMQEQHYETTPRIMQPPEASTKNHILVGSPKENVKNICGGDILYSKC